MISIFFIAEISRPPARLKLRISGHAEDPFMDTHSDIPGTSNFSPALAITH